MRRFGASKPVEQMTKGELLDLIYKYDTHLNRIEPFVKIGELVSEAIEVWLHKSSAIADLRDQISNLEGVEW